MFAVWWAKLDVFQHTPYVVCHKPWKALNINEELWLGKKLTPTASLAIFKLPITQCQFCKVSNRLVKVCLDIPYFCWIKGSLDKISQGRKEIDPPGKAGGEKQMMKTSKPTLLRLCTTWMTLYQWFRGEELQNIQQREISLKDNQRQAIMACMHKAQRFI